MAEHAAFRNIAVHAYFSVDWSLVWTAATVDVPVLREQVLHVISALPQDAPPDAGNGKDAT